MDEQLAAVVQAKALEIHSNGLKNLRAGNIKPYPGFDADPNLKLKGGAYLEFTWGSNRQYRELMGRITKAAIPLGITWMTAVENFPAHITLRETPVNAEPKANLAAFFGPGVNTYFWRDLEQQVRGMQIVLDYLALDGANVVLLALDIKQLFLYWRGQFDANCRDSGWEVKPFPPLCHSSAARMTHIPASFTSERYEELMEPSIQSIKANPLILTVSGVHLGCAYDFLTGRD